MKNLSDTQNEHVPFKHGSPPAYTVNSSTVTLRDKGTK